MQPAGQCDTAKLWQAYHAGRSVAVRNCLIEHYLPLARMHAGRIARRLPPRIVYAEVLSAGCDGLIQAVETFDPAGPQIGADSNDSAKNPIS